MPVGEERPCGCPHEGIWRNRSTRAPPLPLDHRRGCTSRPHDHLSKRSSTGHSRYVSRRPFASAAVAGNMSWRRVRSSRSHFIRTMGSSAMEMVYAQESDSFCSDPPDCLRPRKRIERLLRGRGICLLLDRVPTSRTLTRRPWQHTRHLAARM
jgi:hypothetical protein